MNIKYLIFSLLFIPTLFHADSRKASTEKEKDDFSYWIKASSITGTISLFHTAISGIAARYTHLKAKKCARECIEGDLGYLHLPKNTMHNLAEKLMEKKKVTYEWPDEKRLWQKVTIRLFSESFLKNRFWKKIMLFSVAAGSIVTLACLGTLTYALIKKLTSKKETEQKPANASV
jgi:hypothetical protein